MRTEHEKMMKEFLPALRASAAKMMAEKYHMNQMKIADFLQMTQAAVSKYLSDKYSREVKDSEQKLNVKEVEAFVENVVEGSAYDAQKTVCKMCSRDLTHKCGLMIK